MVAYLKRRLWLAVWLALALAPLDVLGIAWFRSTDHTNMEKYAYYANGALGGLLFLIAIALLVRFMFRRFGRRGGMATVAVLLSLVGWYGWWLYWERHNFPDRAACVTAQVTQKNGHPGVGVCDN